MADHRTEINVPDSLHGMDDLALDMRLISSHRADRVWDRVNPELWAASRNPWAVLKSIGQPELEELGNDDAFRDIDRLATGGLARYIARIRPSPIGHADGPLPLR